MRLRDSENSRIASALTGKELRHYSLMNYRERLGFLERYRGSNQVLSEKYMNVARFPVAEPDVTEAKISDAFILPELF